MSTLTQAELRNLQQMLTARRQQLRNEIHSGLMGSDDKSHRELAGRVQDRGDESVADMLADVRIAGLEQHAREFADVESALARVRDGSYGACLDCGGPIGTQRLMAYPTAKRCTACQTKKENRRGGRDATPSL